VGAQLGSFKQQSMIGLKAASNSLEITTKSKTHGAMTVGNADV